jgi:hypothetical protein
MRFQCVLSVLVALSLTMACKEKERGPNVVIHKAVCPPGTTEDSSQGATADCSGKAGARVSSKSAEISGYCLENGVSMVKCTPVPNICGAAGLQTISADGVRCQDNKSLCAPGMTQDFSQEAVEECRKKAGTSISNDSGKVLAYCASKGPVIAKCAPETNICGAAGISRITEEGIFCKEGASDRASGRIPERDAGPVISATDAALAHDAPAGTQAPAHDAGPVISAADAALAHDAPSGTQVDKTTSSPTQSGDRNSSLCFGVKRWLEIKRASVVFLKNRRYSIVLILSNRTKSTISIATRFGPYSQLFDAAQNTSTTLGSDFPITSYSEADGGEKTHYVEGMKITNEEDMPITFTSDQVEAKERSGHVTLSAHLIIAEDKGNGKYSKSHAILRCDNLIVD